MEALTTSEIKLIENVSGIGSGRYLASAGRILRDAEYPAGCKTQSYVVGGHHVSCTPAEVSLPKLTLSGREKLLYAVAYKAGMRAAQAAGPACRLVLGCQDVEW